MIIYQLKAEGIGWLGNFHRVFDRIVYTTVPGPREIEDFLDRVARRDDHDMGYLEKVHTVRVINLTLEDIPEEDSHGGTYDETN